METLYKGYEIVQPAIFRKKLHTIGNGTTSVKVRAHQIGEEQPITLKTINYPRHDVKALNAAIEKAKQFIDDILLVGQSVKIKKGEFKGLICSIDETNRRRVDKKSLLYLTLNLPGETNPPFVTLRENEVTFL